MRPLARAAIAAGLVDDETLAEFKKWRMLPLDLEVERIEDPERGFQMIQEALESEEQSRLQSTELDLLKWFLQPQNQRKGRLVLIDPRMGTRASKTVTFCVDAKGRYAIPWTSESIKDLMTNEHSYLSYKDEDGKNLRVFFMDLEDIYFGDVKAFMTCSSEDTYVERG